MRKTERKEASMERTAVRSRDIAIVGYDSETSTLEIAFRIGGVYHYSGVPEEVYRTLMTTSSQGIYFDQQIKHQYPHKKIS